MRSQKKGPFIDEPLNKAIAGMNARNEKKIYKTWSRRSTRGSSGDSTRLFAEAKSRQCDLILWGCGVRGGIWKRKACR